MSVLESVWVRAQTLAPPPEQAQYGRHYCTVEGRSCLLYLVICHHTFAQGSLHPQDSLDAPSTFLGFLRRTSPSTFGNRRKSSTRSLGTIRRPK